MASQELNLALSDTATSESSTGSVSDIKIAEQQAHHYKFGITITVFGAALLISFIVIQSLSPSTNTCAAHGSNFTTNLASVKYTATFEDFQSSGVEQIVSVGSFLPMQLIAVVQLFAGVAYLTFPLLWACKLSYPLWNAYLNPMFAASLAVATPILEIALLVMFGIRSAILLFLIGALSCVSYILCYFAETTSIPHGTGEKAPFFGRADKGTDYYTHTPSQAGVIASFIAKALVWIVILWATIYQGNYSTNQFLYWALSLTLLASIVSAVTTIVFCHPCRCAGCPLQSDTATWYFNKQITDLVFDFLAKFTAPWLLWWALRNC